jgi:hypothetical protein
MNKVLAIIGGGIILGSFILVFVGINTEVTGEILCVDGRNRINLEGIMCEDKTTTWFGQHEMTGLFMLIPSLFGLMLFFYALDVFVSGGDE